MNALKMFVKFLCITFLLIIILFLTTFTTTYGLIAPLIPPLSPSSPFYNEVLKANNISKNAKNINLNEKHYIKWMLSKTQVGKNQQGAAYVHETGYFVMEIFLGRPPRPVQGIFDTGSSLVWVQCESSSQQKRIFPIYKQSRSNTYTPISCTDLKKCDRIADDSITGCHSYGDKCEFNIGYIDGDYANGVMATELLSFGTEGKESIVDFKFGCSFNNSVMMMGNIGASDNLYSLPKQLYSYDNRFSYCIPSDLTQTSLVKFGPKAELSGYAINLKKNRHTSYYYINLFGISVNGKRINLDPSILQMSKDGYRGVIIDSGSPFTYLVSTAFHALKMQIQQILGPPSGYQNLEICYTTGLKGRLWPWTKRPVIGIEYDPDFFFEFATERMWHKMPNDNMECLVIYREDDSNLSILGTQPFLDINVGIDPATSHLFLRKGVKCPLLN